MSEQNIIFDADYTCISVGFDLRRHHETWIALPMGNRLRVRFMCGEHEREVEGTRADVVRCLRVAGYRVYEHEIRFASKGGAS